MESGFMRSSTSGDNLTDGTIVRTTVWYHTVMFQNNEPSIKGDRKKKQMLTGGWTDTTPDFRRHFGGMTQQYSRVSQ